MTAQATKPSVRRRSPPPRGQGFPACRTPKSVHRKDFGGSPRIAPPIHGGKAEAVRERRSERWNSGLTAGGAVRYFMSLSPRRYLP